MFSVKLIAVILGVILLKVMNKQHTHKTAKQSIPDHTIEK